MLKIINLPPPLHSSDFEITCTITPWIVLHLVQLLLQIYAQLVWLSRWEWFWKEPLLVTNISTVKFLQNQVESVCQLMML